MVKRLKQIHNQNALNKKPHWYHNDVWYFSHLGIDGRQADNNSTFSFEKIKQSWLKDKIKQYIFHCSVNKSCHFISSVISSLITFSDYLNTLRKNHRLISLDNLTREMIIGYFNFLVKKANSATTRQTRILNLARFLEVCKENTWIKYNGKLIYPEDIPARPSKSPRFIPDPVVKQLNEKLDQMDPHIRRMVLVLQETGMRINELVKLSFDCIYPDNEGDYFFKYFQSKLNKDHVIPISASLAATIKEQQAAVQEEWVNSEWLFTVPKYITPIEIGSPKKAAQNRGKQWARRTLARYLHEFTRYHQIRGEDGQIWQSGFHAFRHTVATKMINHDVPQHIVQRFLGHESPTMTARYAHIMDQTLKKSFAEFKGKFVNVAVAVLEPKEVAMNLASGSDPKDIDALWLKKNIMAQALPNGICSLPVISNSCPHANACLTCVNFRTDHRYLNIHKQQLEKTEAIIKQAEANHWQRQLEMNTVIKTNLQKIIIALESSSHDPQA